MKRILTLFFVAVMLVTSLALPLHAEEAKSVTIPDIGSGAAIVLDAQTGAILYRKNDTALLPPADSAQMMTVLLALESGKADETVTVTEQIASTFDSEKTNIPLKQGETVKIRDLLYAIMLQSYSDACKTVAIAVSGSEEAFAAKMTARMTQITGNKGSNFANADGEPHDKNKTSAYDLALLTREAMKNEEFRTIFGKVAYTMSATNLNTSTRDLKAICKLFSDKEFAYDGTVGAKSGYNKDAKYTLVSAAKKDGRTLICVVLSSNSSDQRYEETIALLDYGFQAFRNVTVPTDLISPTKIPVMNSEGNYTRWITVSIPEGTLLTTNLNFKDGTMSVPALPSYVKEGDTNLSLTVSAKDDNNVSIVLGTINLAIQTVEVEVEDTQVGQNKPKEETFGTKVWKVVKTILFAILYVILGIVVLILALFVVSYLQRRQRIANRRKLREQAEEDDEDEQPVYTGRRHRRLAEPEEDEDDEDDENNEDDYFIE